MKYSFTIKAYKYNVSSIHQMSLTVYALIGIARLKIHGFIICYPLPTI